MRARVCGDYGSGSGGSLLLLRHGQSLNNAADVFTGWSDARLSDLGGTQARGAAAAMRALDVRPTCVHTSLHAATGVHRGRDR